ncbi:hypothetical protein M5D96_007408, partial [Drosophila gunungcola]
ANESEANRIFIAFITSCWLLLGFSAGFPKGVEFSWPLSGHCVGSQPAIHLRAPKLFHFQLPDADASSEGNNIFEISLVAAACFSLPLPFGLRCFPSLVPTSLLTTPSKVYLLVLPICFQFGAAPKKLFSIIAPLSPGNLPFSQYANNCVYILGNIFSEYLQKARSSLH